MKSANRHFDTQLPFFHLTFFLTVFFCLFSDEEDRADSLKYEEPSYLESFGIIRGAIGGIKSFNGYIFVAYSSVPIVDVFTNGLRLGLNVPYVPVAILPDGAFVMFGDSNHIVSKYENGQFDPTFSAPPPEVAGGRLVDAVTQKDGKIVVAVDYPPGPQGSGIYRLNPDGSKDGSFGGGSTGRMIVQPDGKILVLNFGIYRLSSDGHVDPDFHPPTFNGGQIVDVGLQPDGGIIVAGSFATVNGFALPSLVRLFPSGDLDAFFRPINIEMNFGFITQMQVQSNGDIVIGTLSSKIRRFFSDGRLDNSVTLGGVAFGIDQADKIICELGDNETLYQYSGRRRIRSTGSTIDQVFEQSSSIGKGAAWSFAKAVPANTTLEFLLADSFDPGNHFFRLRSTP